MTIQELEKMKAEGKIKNFQVPGGVSKSPNHSKVRKSKKSSGKEWMAKNLWAWGIQHKVEIQAEYAFHEERKWRFDHAIPTLKIGIEYEGLMSDKSRHTTITGYTGDAEKYNAATAGGWKILRYTAKNYKNLITDLNKVIDEARRSA